MQFLGFQAPRSQFRVFAEPHVVDGVSGRRKVNHRDTSRTPTARVFPLMTRPGHAASRVTGKGARIGSLGLPVSPQRSRNNQPRLSSSSSVLTSGKADPRNASPPEKKSHKRGGSLVISSEELPQEECGVEVGFDGDAEDSEDTEVALDAVSLDAVSLEAVTLDQLGQDYSQLVSSEIDVSGGTMKPGGSSPPQALMLKSALG